MRGKRRSGRRGSLEDGKGILEGLRRLLGRTQAGVARAHERAVGRGLDDRWDRRQADVHHRLLLGGPVGGEVHPLLQAVLAAKEAVALGRRVVAPPAPGDGPGAPPPVRHHHRRRRGGGGAGGGRGRRELDRPGRLGPGQRAAAGAGAADRRGGDGEGGGGGRGGGDGGVLLALADAVTLAA